MNMLHFIANSFRTFNYFFVSKKATYFLGMLLVRLSRKVRKMAFKNNAKTQMVTINNFMGNLKMRIDVNSYMGGSIFWTGFHHLNELLFLKSFLKPEMVFIDIGANQGEFSIYAASILKNGKVFSFEPVNKQASYFKENVKQNNYSNVQLFEYGLSNVIGEFPIYTSNSTELHSGIHEGLSTLYKTDTRGDFEQTVQLKVFDNEFTNTFSRMDFIKIDIEGAELFALKGMINHLKKFKPAILIEINGDTFSAAGYSTKEMCDFLSELNYQPYEIKRGSIYKIAFDQLEANARNYVFI